MFAIFVVYAHTASVTSVGIAAIFNIELWMKSQSCTLKRFANDKVDDVRRTPPPGYFKIVASCIVCDHMAMRNANHCFLHIQSDDSNDYILLPSQPSGITPQSNSFDCQPRHATVARHTLEVSQYLQRANCSNWYLGPTLLEFNCLIRTRRWRHNLDILA